MRTCLLSIRPHDHATHLAVVMCLISLLAHLSLPQRASGQAAGNMDDRSWQRTGVSSPPDIIPGVVVVKLKHTNAGGKGSPMVQAVPHLSQSFSACGVTSLARAFPMRAPLSDAEVAAGKVDLSRIHFAEIPMSMDPVEVARQLATLPEVEYAEPKYRYYLCEVPNDSNYVVWQQRYFDQMHVAEGWALQKGSADVVIATVDGGTNWHHEDLNANLWINPLEDINHNGRFDKGPPPSGDEDGKDQDGNGKVDDVIGWNFTNNTNDPRGFLSVPGSADHGTETASTFGAVTNNALGMAGTGWNCRLMPVCGADPAVDLSVVHGFEGIEYASRMGARVINCSWERAGGSDNFVKSEQDLITAATQGGALVVAAAGNNNGQNLDERPFYPASYDHVLSVGATRNGSDEIAYFTDIGLNVSVFAPGMAIRVAKDNDSYGTDQGTSHSSPLVAGLAGLLFASHPDWTPDMVATQIRMTSDPIDGSNPDHAGSLGHGRVNFFRALSEVHSGVAVLAGRFHTPSGRALFLKGDTVILSVKVKNVLPLAAENLSFNVSVDPVLAPLGSIFGPVRLDAGAGDSVDCVFRVGTLPGKLDVKVRFGWSANNGERDARMFKTTLYAAEGYWERQMSPTTARLLSVHAVSSRVAWACGYDISSWFRVVLKTTDGGENWVIVNGDLPNDPRICVFAVDSLHAWVAGGWGQIFATVNGGVSWMRQDYPAPQSGLIKALWFFDAANGYAWGEPDTYVLGQPGKPGRFVVLKTSNGGTTWTHLANEPFGITGEYGLNAFCCTDKQHIWFGAPDSTIWRTSDGGNTWASAIVGTAEVSGLAMRDNSVGIMCSSQGRNNEPSFFARTTDGGATWQPLPGIKGDEGYAAAFPAGSTDAWIAGMRTVACSHDNGVSWAQEPTESFSPTLSAISFSDSMNGWMVTEWGDILRYRSRSATEPSSLVEPWETLPVQALLEQNYPNPFNPKTVISSQLPAASNVKLIVYDVLGRDVAVLVNERRAAGNYEDTFDGSGLASGVYIYRLTAGSLVQSRKMVLLK